MKQLATLSLLLTFLLIMTFPSCTKDDSVNMKAPKLPYVNLKYPAIGQKSLYKYYETTAESNFCEATYDGDTIIMEIFEETTEGFLIRRFLSDYSYSQTNTDGAFFLSKFDTIFTELIVRADTAFLINETFNIDPIFHFDKIPLSAASNFLKEPSLCKSIIASVPGLVLGDTLHLTQNPVTLDEHIFYNSSTYAYLDYFLNAVIVKEVNLSSYHQIFRSFYGEGVFGPIYFASGFELIVD